jgi:hypothetical protein
MRTITSTDISQCGLELKHVVLSCFTQRAAETACQLDAFDEADWRRILFWLDISGMAIYLLDQLKRSGLEEKLPRLIREQLHERWRNNKAKTTALMMEASLIANWFDQALIPYALLKGFTLTPDSAPEASLRWQTDLDFLIPKASRLIAGHYVMRLGYTLHAEAGSTMEFRAGDAGVPDLALLYAIHAQRSLELHTLARERSVPDLLTRARIRTFEGGASVSCLSGPDTMVQQALHLLKHLCGEHTRMSWVLEFWRHVHSMKDDAGFWAEVRALAGEEDGRGNIAMAVSLWLAADIFDDAAPELTREWTSQHLPKRVRLWLELYSRGLLLGDSVGSKLYAILRREVPFVGSGSTNLRKILLPSYLPARITKTVSGETILSSLRRWFIEACYFYTRLRFHLVEGLRFAVESTRWKRAVARVEK